MQKIFVKPLDGLMMRDPVTLRHLNPEGEYVPNSTFWQRRLLQRDVIEVKPDSGKKPFVKTTKEEEIKPNDDKK